MKKLLFMLSIMFLFSFSTVSAFANSFQGVNYSVIKESSMATIKASIDIRLEQKVSKNFLQKFALKLKAAESVKYDRMFISYYLPGMTPGNGAWATSHFNPDLKVIVLGLSLEQEKASASKPKKSSNKLIGEWTDNSAYGGKYTFLKKNGKTLMTVSYSDGSSSTKEMIQKKQGGKLRLEEKAGNDFGEYYLIDNGKLGVYDSEGMIKILR